MSCISVSISPVRTPFSASAERIGGIAAHAGCLNGLSADADVMNWITVRAERVCQTNIPSRISFRAKSVNKISVSAYLVCTINDGEQYLAVREGQLLTIDNGFITVNRT